MILKLRPRHFKHFFWISRFLFHFLCIWNHKAIVSMQQYLKWTVQKSWKYLCIKSSTFFSLFSKHPCIFVSFPFGFHPFLFSSHMYFSLSPITRSSLSLPLPFVSCLWFLFLPYHLLSFSFTCCISLTVSVPSFHVPLVSPHPGPLCYLLNTHHVPAHRNQPVECL